VSRLSLTVIPSKRSLRGGTTIAAGAASDIIVTA
jgi:hypothetical protein